MTTGTPSVAFETDLAGMNRAESVVRRVARSPASWLVLLVGASTILRGLIGLRVASPWILPDEIVYSELAKSIAEGSRPSIRGVPVFGWGEVYPTLIAPAWMLFDDPVRAYHAALVINSLVMSLAAVPAYLLARMFVSRSASFVVAVTTVLVPSMAYTGVVMTENACYPAFLLSVWLIARAVRNPTLGAQAIALAGIGLVAFTRIQGGALVGAYVGAIVVYAAMEPRSERGAYLRRFLPSLGLALLVVIAPFVASVARGDGPFGWLGARSRTFDELVPREIPQWLVYLAADLVLYVAVVPVAATAVVVGRALSRSASEQARLFAAVVLPTVSAILVSISVVSASFDVDETENLNERYVFYVVPLLFVGLALWIRQGLQRPRPWTSIVLATCGLLALVVPIERLSYNARFQSLALLPWLELPQSRGALLIGVASFVVLTSLLWLTCRAERVRLLWIVVGAWMALVGAMAVDESLKIGSYFARSFEPRKETWIDDAVPEGAKVGVVWRENPGVAGPDLLYFSVMVTEMFNESVGPVYQVGGPNRYQAFLPTMAARIQDSGLVSESGAHVDARYVLATCRATVDGRVIATSPDRTLRLIEARTPIRLAPTERCPAPLQGRAAAGGRVEGVK